MIGLILGGHPEVADVAVVLPEYCVTLNAPVPVNVEIVKCKKRYLNWKQLCLGA